MRLARTPFWRRCATGLGLALALAAPARAAIQIGLNDSEFFMVLWDPVAEASYTLDLGLTFGTLLTDGQSDSGYQQFWTLDPAADANLSRLLALGTSLQYLKWGVFSADFEGFNFIDGDLTVFTTLEHNTPTGTVNPNYSTLITLTNTDVETMLGPLTTFGLFVNADASNPYNGHNDAGADNYAANGSQFAAKGTPGYIAEQYLLQNLGSPDRIPSVLNAVGRSSWAYFLTQKDGFDGTQPVVADEFDNLEHDAYWGLAEDPDTGILYLSYTLDAVGLTEAQREFALGIGRTEHDGGFAMRRLDSVAAAGAESPAGVLRPLGGAYVGPVSAVPEPASAGLFAAGLLLLARVARRRA